MLIENIENNNIRITLSANLDEFSKQRLIDYLKYLEATANSQATQEDIDQLADEVNLSWWSANKSRFINEDNS